VPLVRALSAADPDLMIVVGRSRSSIALMETAMPGKPWRVSEVRVLTDGIRRALAPGEVTIPGRSAIAVRRMAARLGLIGDGVPRQRWSAQQREKLAELVNGGWTATRIAEASLLPHNRNAVQKQMQRMGLGSAGRSSPQKAATRLHGLGLDRFHAFIQANARICTPAQIADLWNQQHGGANVSHRKVVYHLGQLGLRLPRRVVVRMAYSVEKRARSVVPSVAAGSAITPAMPGVFAPGMEQSVAYARGA